MIEWIAQHCSDQRLHHELFLFSIHTPREELNHTLYFDDNRHLVQPSAFLEILLDQSEDYLLDLRVLAKSLVVELQRLYRELLVALVGFDEPREG